jgi:GNAT superfamily N-acetyltransferase
VACVEGEVVGSLGLETSPTRWRTRHVGSIGMAVRDDWQGRGIGTALMEAALDLADNWLNLTRIELRVYVDNAAGVGPSPKTCAPILRDSVSYVENHNPIYAYIINIIPIGA